MLKLMIVPVLAISVVAFQKLDESAVEDSVSMRNLLMFDGPKGLGEKCSSAPSNSEMWCKDGCSCTTSHGKRSTGSTCMGGSCTFNCDDPDHRDSYMSIYCQQKRGVPRKDIVV